MTRVRQFSHPPMISPVSVVGGVEFVLGSIPSSADPMVERFAYILYPNDFKLSRRVWCRWLTMLNFSRYT